MNKKVAAQFESLIEDILYGNCLHLPAIPTDYTKEVDALVVNAKEAQQESEEVYEEFLKSNEYGLFFYKNEKPNFSKDDFLFPKWTPEETYRRQLEALEFAYSCAYKVNLLERAVEAMRKTSQGGGGYLFVSRRSQVFKAEIIYEATSGSSSEMIKGNATEKDKSSEQIGEYIFEELLNYEEAKNRVMELDKRGIPAILLISPDKTHTTKQVEKLREQRVGWLNAYDMSYGKDIFNALKGNINRCVSDYKELTAKQSKHIDIDSDGGFFWAGLIICPPYCVVFGIVCIVSSIKAKKRTKVAESYKKPIFAACKKRLSTEFIKIKNQLPNQKIDDAYNFLSKVQKSIADKTCEMEKILKANQAEFKKAVDFLPPNLDVELLPQIIDQMKSGAATDYKTAVRQAMQDEDQRSANEAMQILQQTEAEMQRRQQEYFQNKQLQLAREQAASQKRAEEYAKQQADAAKVAAENAQKQAEASAAAAKAAEKQAADTEEFLRRTDDPYYINKWKNGN